ncbi:hypothetical protein IFM89_016728 [Coptis chinensis]|uniref:Uncharacterized protein n=1 Tax=Coptis chinensis TaxID=261450 RepID=A0A835MBS8_9MAGN|nr:hypothetical protein IFM89_016728 [Coptis chinensis]
MGVNKEKGFVEAIREKASLNTPSFWSCALLACVSFLFFFFINSFFNPLSLDPMGGGNGQKAKMAREKNLEKQKAAGKGSQLEANKKAMSIQCKVCMQTFICTTSEVKCREHAEAKHPKSDVNTCFPHLKESTQQTTQK